MNAIEYGDRSEEKSTAQQTINKWVAEFVTNKTYTIDTVQEQRRLVLAMSDYYDKFGITKLIMLNRVDKEHFMSQISARRMKEFWPRAAFMLKEQSDENEGDENKSDEREGEKEDEPDNE